MRLAPLTPSSQTRTSPVASSIQRRPLHSPAEGDGDVVDEEPGLKLAEAVDREVAARAPGGIPPVRPPARDFIPPSARPEVRAKGPALTDRPIYTTPPANLGGGGRGPPQKKDQ